MYSDIPDILENFVFSLEDLEVCFDLLNNFELFVLLKRLERRR
jgi:hypothetical protein